MSIIKFKTKEQVEKEIEKILKNNDAPAEIRFNVNNFDKEIGSFSLKFIWVYDAIKIVFMPNMFNNGIVRNACSISLMFPIDMEGYRVDGSEAKKEFTKRLGGMKAWDVKLETVVKRFICASINAKKVYNKIQKEYGIPKESIKINCKWEKIELPINEWKN